MAVWEQNKILLLAMVLACGHAGCRTSDQALHALNTLQKQIDEAIIAGDTERYVALLADDAVLMPPNGPPIVGKSAIRSWNQEMSKRFRIQKYAPVDQEIIQAGDWAFRRATFDWSLVPVAGGQPIQDSGKFIIIYKRQVDGSWRVARDIWNSNTPR